MLFSGILERFTGCSVDDEIWAGWVKLITPHSSARPPEEHSQKECDDGCEDEFISQAQSSENRVVEWVLPHEMNVEESEGEGNRFSGQIMKPRKYSTSHPNLLLHQIRHWKVDNHAKMPKIRQLWPNHGCHSLNTSQPFLYRLEYKECYANLK